MVLKEQTHLLLVFCCGYLLSGAPGQTIDDANRLFADLLNTTYNKNVRPVIDQTQAIQVQLGFSLTSVNELDSVGQEVTLVGVLAVRWRDEILTWNATQYGGIANMKVFQKYVWRPALFLGGATEKFEEIGYSFTKVTILADGSVFWFPPGIYTFGCSVDVRHFPFDTQTCTLYFGLSSENIDEVMLSSMGDSINIQSYTENVDWDLISTRSYISVVNVNGMPSQIHKNEVTLKRRAAFIILHFAAPVILLSALNIMIFILPVESGERISFAITLFLAFAIFIAMISENLPKNSLTLPYFSIYLIVINIFSTMYVVASLMVIKVYHTSSTRKVPVKLAEFLRQDKKHSPQCRNKVESVADVDQGKDNKTMEAAHANCFCEDNIDSTVQPEVTWVDLSKAVDWILFRFFALLLTVLTIIFAVLLTVGG